MQVDVQNHFWLADDGRVYGSKKQTIVTESDADFVAWKAAGGIPTPWPRDDAGNQTNPAMQDVLTAHRLFVDLVSYSAYARFNKFNAGITVGGRPFPTDTIAQADLNAAYIYTNEQGNQSQTYQWKLPDGTWMQLDKIGIGKMQANIHNFKEKCFTAEQDTSVKIGSNTITTRAAVDAAYAAVSNVYPAV